jgi:hypothetical protein
MGVFFILKKFIHTSYLVRVKWVVEVPCVASRVFAPMKFYSQPYPKFLRVGFSEL